MAAPSKSYTDITDSQVDADSPLDTTLVTAVRDNIVHLKEWLGASYTAVDHDHDGLNSKPISGFPRIAGDVVLASAATERTDNSGVMTKAKEVQELRGGTLRLKFDMKTDNVGVAANAQVYCNGAPVGTLHTTSSLSYVSFSEDVSGWFPGDLVQLYIKTATAPFTAFVKNFSLCASNGVVLLD